MRASGGEHEELREALVEQLAYLMDEVDALGEVIVRVPDPILSGRPYEGELSIKEMYGVIALADETVFLPQIERLSEGGDVVIAHPDNAVLAAREPWSEYEMEVILARVKQARRRLVERVQTFDAAGWEAESFDEPDERGLYALLHAVIQHDTDMLRAAGHRLHESRLGGGANSRSE